MKTPLSLIPQNYAELLWTWIEAHPGCQAIDAATGIGSSYTTMSHELTRMSDANQLERIRVQVPGKDGKKPTSPYHYWALGSTFKPRRAAPQRLVQPVPHPVPPSFFREQAFATLVSTQVAKKDPLEAVKDMKLSDIVALRNALNETFA